MITIVPRNGGPPRDWPFTVYRRVADGELQWEWMITHELTDTRSPDPLALEVVRIPDPPEYRGPPSYGLVSYARLTNEWSHVCTFVELPPQIKTLVLNARDQFQRGTLVPVPPGGTFGYLRNTSHGPNEFGMVLPQLPAVKRERERMPRERKG